MALYTLDGNPIGSDKVITQDMIVNVGNGGDFSTINEAITYLSGFYPIYKKGGIKCYINILDGTVISEQIACSQMDVQWITIVSNSTNTERITVGGEAKTVNIVSVKADNKWTYNMDEHDARNTYPFICAENAGKAPTIGCLFKLVENTSGMDISGLICNRGSEGVVLGWSGFDSFSVGCIANNESSITIRQGIARNCIRWGVHSRHNGECSARSALLTNCGIGAYSDRIADLDIREAVLDGCTIAIDCENASRINANEAHLNGCGDTSNVNNPCIVVRDGSILNCTSIDIENPVSQVFTHSGGAIIACNQLAVTNPNAVKVVKTSYGTNLINQINASGIFFTGATLS